MLIKSQPWVSKDVDTHKNISFLPTGSTVACSKTIGNTMDALNHTGTWKRRPQGKKLQIESNKNWTQIHQDEKKTCKGHTLSVEEHLRNEMLETNRTKTDDKLNELIDHFAQVLKQECFNERERTVSRTIQPPKHTNSEHNEAIGQTGIRMKNKEHN